LVSGSALPATKSGAAPWGVVDVAWAAVTRPDFRKHGRALFPAPILDHFPEAGIGHREQVFEGLSLHLKAE
jgi:hypothetical protein